MESTDAKSLIINRSPSRYKLFKHSGGNHQNQAQFRRTQDHSEELFQKLQQIFKQFPGSKRVRSAYASVCGKMYASRENRTRDVPSKLIGKLKKWSAQYPDDIEFQEALFDVTLYHLTYAQGQRNSAPSTIWSALPKPPTMRCTWRKTPCCPAWRS